MIKQINLENFRCFEKHAVSFRQMSVIVGKNNAGKSTLIEALRLISIVVTRYRNLTYKEPPAWLSLGKKVRGVSPSMEGIEFNFETVFHRYGEPPAKITVDFVSNEKIELYISAEESIYAILYESNGEMVRNKHQAGTIEFPQVHILPQIGPLSRHERRLGENYVRSNESSYLSSLHLRNQLYIHKNFRAKFRSLARDTWDTLEVMDLSLNDDNVFSLLVRDGDFVAEAAQMGHGLQMWLQIVWFLSRFGKTDTLIMDEPDVYLHADLQRRLIRVLKSRAQQTIVATHSIEILAEVDPSSILIMNRNKPRSRYATSIDGVQKIVDEIGGVHNLQLTRLGTSRKCLFVEGKDVKFLSEFHRKLFTDNQDGLSVIPNMPVGGWGGWNKVLNVSEFLRNEANETIQSYCLFDRDFHTVEEISTRLKQAQDRGVRLYIWSKKEIENYLLVPRAIHRAIMRSSDPDRRPALADVNLMLEQIVESMKEELIWQLVEDYENTHKGIKAKGARSKIIPIVEEQWTSLDNKLNLVSGKMVIAALADWANSTFGIHLSAGVLLHALLPTELHPDIRIFMTALEYNVSFDSVGTTTGS